MSASDEYDLIKYVHRHVIGLERGDPQILAGLVNATPGLHILDSICWWNVALLLAMEVERLSSLVAASPPVSLPDPEQEMSDARDLDYARAQALEWLTEYAVLARGWNAPDDEHTRIVVRSLAEHALLDAFASPSVPETTP